MSVVSTEHIQMSVPSVSSPKVGNSNPQVVESTIGKSPPTINHITAHIKLIKYFNSLRFQVSDWDLFVKNGIRRYIWFITLLRNRLKQSSPGQFKPSSSSHSSPSKSPKTSKLLPHVSESQQLSGFTKSSISTYRTQSLKSMLPPIDILYIWYTLVLRTRSFYETGVRFRFLEFSLLSFPIFPVILSISPAHGYQPSTDYVNNFMILTSGQIVYDWRSSFTHMIPIHCPLCSTKLGTVLLKDFVNNDADTSFNLSECRCRFEGPITVHQLLKRQIYSDVISNSRPLPLIHQTKSHYLYQTGTQEYVDDLDELDKSLKRMLKSGLSQLKLASCSVEDFFLSIDDNFEKVYSDYYSHQNLLHLTVPVHSPIQVNEDFEIFGRREKFQYNTIKAVGSTFQSGAIIAKAIAKYETFFQILSETYRFYSLVPLVDIDLIWQTHKLSPYEYIEYSRTRCNNNLVDYEDSNTNESLTTNFDTTCHLYKKMYRRIYTECRCYYCFRSSKLVKRSQYSPKIQAFCTVPSRCILVADGYSTIVQSTQFLP